jgi:hypothetical protein
MRFAIFKEGSASSTPSCSSGPVGSEILVSCVVPAGKKLHDLFARHAPPPLPNQVLRVDDPIPIGISANTTGDCAFTDLFRHASMQLFPVLAAFPCRQPFDQ